MKRYLTLFVEANSMRPALEGEIGRNRDNSDEASVWWQMKRLLLPGG
jgi:hypothetical protein